MNDTQRAARMQKTRTEHTHRDDAPRTPSTGTAPLLERAPEYLSVKEAALRLGISQRTVYGYLQSGTLAGARIGDLVVVNAQAVATLKRRAPGRARTTIPRWRTAPENNQGTLMSITVRLRPGQQEGFHHHLQQMRRTNAHCFPGTAARYIVRNQVDPDEVEIVLLWRAAIAPSEEQRGKALAALAAEFSDVFDWEHATMKEGQVLLHA